MVQKSLERFRDNLVQKSQENPERFQDNLVQKSLEKPERFRDNLVQKSLGNPRNPRMHVVRCSTNRRVHMAGGMRTETAPWCPRLSKCATTAAQLQDYKLRGKATFFKLSGETESEAQGLQAVMLCHADDSEAQGLQAARHATCSTLLLDHEGHSLQAARPGLVLQTRVLQRSSCKHCKLPGKVTMKHAPKLKDCKLPDMKTLCKFLGKIVRKAQDNKNAWQGHVVQTLVEMVPKG